MIEGIVQCIVLLDVVVAGAVTQLGHADYHRRETATQVLPLLGPLAFPHLDAACHSADPEVVMRAERIAVEARRAFAEQAAATVLPTDYPHLPWIDMLPPDLEERQDVLSRYLDMIGGPICAPGTPGWPEYRRATFFYVRDLFLEGKSEKEVVQVLDRMVRKEREWLRYGGDRWLDSPALRGR